MRKLKSIFIGLISVMFLCFFIKELVENARFSVAIVLFLIGVITGVIALFEWEDKENGRNS